MDSVAQTFAGLVKNNNGLFKSATQAKFLLSQCQEKNTFVTGGSVYKSSFTLFYKCDDKGVVSVEKYLPRTGKNEIQWQRAGAGATVQDEKKIKSLQREIKSLEKTVKQRQEAWQSGSYNKSNIDLYHSAMKRDQELLNDLKSELDALTK